MKIKTINCQKELIDLSMELLYKQVGITEKTGKNDGEFVEMYLTSLGLAKGNPYCVAGQYWTFEEAAKQLKLKNPLPKTGLAVKMFQLVQSEITEGEPQKGDFVFWIKPNKINGHLERITAILSNGKVQTIGFNTNNGKTGSQREGNGVFMRTRDLNKNLGDMKILGLIHFE